MNYETIKNELIEMIKEAENLPESDLELINGTDIKIKKGKTRLFENRAYNYFEYIHNVIIKEDIDFVTDIYNMLKKDIREKTLDYYQSKAYEITMDSKDEAERLEQLKKSLNAIKNNLEKKETIRKNIVNGSSNDRKEKLARIDEEINIILGAQDEVVSSIKEVKNNINAKFIEVINEERDNIIYNFTTSLRGTEIAYGIDGKSILASEKEEYDALIELLKIINKVDDSKELTTIDGVICVNNNQVDDVKDLFNKITLFNKLKKKEQKEEIKIEGINSEIINAIIAELEKTKSSKKRNNLISALRILNIPRTGRDKDDRILPYSVMPTAKEIIDNVFIPQKYIDEFIELIKNTKFLSDYVNNPEFNSNLRKQLENEQLIRELKDYLKSIEKKYNEFNGVYNIPSVQASDGTIILEEDEKEYENVLVILNLLEQPSEKLYNVKGVGNVSKENISKFENLINSTKYFEDKKIIDKEPEVTEDNVLEVPVQEKEKTIPTIELQPNVSNNNPTDKKEPEKNNDSEELGQQSTPASVSTSVEDNKKMNDKNSEEKLVKKDKLKNLFKKVKIRKLGSKSLGWFNNMRKQLIDYAREGAFSLSTADMILAHPLGNDVELSGLATLVNRDIKYPSVSEDYDFYIKLDKPEKPVERKEFKPIRPQGNVGLTLEEEKARLEAGKIFINNASKKETENKVNSEPVKPVNEVEETIKKEEIANNKHYTETEIVTAIIEDDNLHGMTEEDLGRMSDGDLGVSVSKSNSVSEPIVIPSDVEIISSIEKKERETIHSTEEIEMDELTKRMLEILETQISNVQEKINKGKISPQEEATLKTTLDNLNKRREEILKENSRGL